MFKEDYLSPTCKDENLNMSLVEWNNGCWRQKKIIKRHTHRRANHTLSRFTFFTMVSRQSWDTSLTLSRQQGSSQSSFRSIHIVSPTNFPLPLISKENGDDKLSSILHFYTSKVVNLTVLLRRVWHKRLETITTDRQTDGLAMLHHHTVSYLRPTRPSSQRHPIGLPNKKKNRDSGPKQLIPCF